MSKFRILAILAATMSVALLSGCGGGGGTHVSGTYSDISKTVIMRLGNGRAQFGSAFGAMVREKGGSDTGKYTVKGDTVTITIAAPGGDATMKLQIEKDGCLYSNDMKEELCKQK